MSAADSTPRPAPLHVALLAGGSGTRFWPLSRAARPKQLLALTGRQSLLAATWGRVRRLVPPERLWVVAPAALAGAVRRELPELERRNLIVEPAPRDTGPAIALACATIARREPRAVVGIFPTDHVIRDAREFVRCVRAAAAEAADGALVCLAIRPDRPATGFGYLRCRAARGGAGRALVVERFVEKPDAARARRFLGSGRYYWNAGMFVWRAERFREELERTAPGISRAVERHLDGARAAWSSATRLSVDYAVMERARGVKAVALDAGWDDVGSWDAALRLRGATARGAERVVLVDSAGSGVFEAGAAGRTVAVVDLPGVVVVDTPDALLVVSRAASEKVRRVVEELRRRKRTDLL